jgi:protein SCO1/2
MTNKQRLLTIVFILLSFVLWAGLLWLPGVLAKWTTPNGYGTKVDRAIPAMSITNVEGQPLSLDRFSGQFVYFYIGYLNCNGVCQSHLSTLFQLDRNAAKSLPFNIVFMTMDPERDTAEVLANRINSLGERFHGVLPASFAAGQAIARAFNVPYAKQPSRIQAYEIDHAAFVFLIDPSGRWIRTYTGRYLNAEHMLNELDYLSQGYFYDPI